MSISSDNPGRADLRLKLSLDGVWDFSFEGPGAGLSGSDHRIRTPGIWQAQFAALRNVQGVGRYRRRIDIPSDWTGRSLVLVMEGVFHESVVMIDSVPIAIHGDGWTPIEVDLTPILDGRTSFVLGVEARAPDDRSGGRFSVSLAGKQDWYGVQGESGSRRASRRAIMPTFVHEAKLSRQGLDHGLDFRLHVAGSRRKSPRAPSSAQHRGELTRRRLRRVATTCAVMFGKRRPFRTNGGPNDGATEALRPNPFVGCVHPCTLRCR